MRRIVLGLVLLGCATARPSAVDVVERELAAYNAQDADAFAATYAEDATVTRGGKVWLQGRKAISEAYAGMFAKYPNCRARIAERRVEDQAVVDHEISLLARFPGNGGTCITVNDVSISPSRLLAVT